MWLLPLVILGAIALAAANRSSRDALPPSRQLAAPPAGPANPNPVSPPGPISVLGEILRIGQSPPPQVILCAIAEAESIGRSDLASDIVQAFVVPAVARGRSGAMPSPGYERGSCALPRDPRAQASPRGSCAPVGSPHAQDYQRGTCAPVGSPRAQADYSRGTCAPPPPPPPPAPPPSFDVGVGAVPPQTAAAPQITSRYATQDEILAMLETDPNAFLRVMATGRPPVIEVPIAAAPSPPVPAPAAVAPAAAPPSAPVAAPMPPQQPIATPTVDADQFAEQLVQLPGFAGAGVVLADPSTGAEVFEVRWLRGYAVPALPPQVSNRAVRVVIVDELARIQPAPTAYGPQPTGLPPETVAQMQEAAGLPEAADRTRALAPGSPLGGVPDGAWREFVMRLEREEPTFDSSRHVGQYRQRRERLAELGIDPRAFYGSAAAQRAALDADLANAHHHATEGGVIAEHLHRTIAVPGHDGIATITLSGLLGVIQCAGLDGAVGWLERPNDRKRYPHTTQAFLRTNGVF